MRRNPYIIENTEWFRHRPELLKLVEIIRHEVQQVQRPAEEVIIDDCELQQLLKVSRRTTANYRAQGLITYHHLGGKVFYLLSDVLDAIKRNRIPAIQEQLKFKA